MGYRFQQLKEERERQLRAICARELRGSESDLFSPRPGTYTPTYNCQLKSGSIPGIQLNLTGLLTLTLGGKISFWAQGGTLGFLCAEDAEDLLLHVPAAEPGQPVAVAKIISKPNAFATCQIALLPLDLNAVEKVEEQVTSL